VYANGDDINPPRRVSLPRRILNDVDEVMEHVNKHVNLVSGAARLWDNKRTLALQCFSPITRPRISDADRI